MNTVIEVHDLTVSYNKKPVLWNVDFEIPEGQLVGIVGPNGAGKSTLLKSIMGLLKYDSGHIKIWDNNLDSCRKKVAYVPQRETVDWDFPVNVFDVTLMGRYPHKSIIGRINSKDKEIAFDALKKVNMQDFLDRQISELSGGQQQRTFLARAICQEADLYILDEPFAGVDIATEKSIISLLKELISQGKTILVVHHDLNTVSEYFDHVLMVNTILVASGKTEKVFNEENLKKTYGGKLSLLTKVQNLVKNESYPLRKG